MQRDLGMSDVQWSAGISLFYAGYMVSQLPVRSSSIHHIVPPFRTLMS